MRFLHSADLHLDSPLRAQALKNPDLALSLHAASRTALSSIVDAAISHNVDALLLAGDVFDSSVVDVAARAALAAELGRLGRAGIPAVIIQGNHDALLDLDRFGPIAENVVLLNADRPTFQVGGAAIHGLGFGARHVADSLLPQYPAPESGKINIGLMHTSLGGAPGHDPYAPCAEADLLAHGYDYWALGHIHQRFERRGENTLAVMPGIPQGRSIREVGGGSATLVEVDLDGIRAREVPIALLQFATVTADLSDAESQAAQIEKMGVALAAAKTENTALAARIMLTGAGALLGDSGFARSLADMAAEQLDGVYIEAVRFAKSRDATPPGALADLAQMMIKDAATPGFRDEAAAVLEEWHRALPRDIFDVLAPEMLDELIAEGIDMTLMRLAGKGQSE